MKAYIATRMSAGVITLGLCFSLLSGCASTHKLRASESLKSENKMEKIALIGSSRVVRPRMGGKEPILSLSDSKKSVELTVDKIKSVFATKGYEVVYAKPVGVGYSWPGAIENWVYNYEAADGEPNKWQVLDNKPVYEYDSTAGNSEYRQSVRDEFERLNKALYSDLDDVYLPKIENLKVIQQATGGDTICQVHASGVQYSIGRKIGDYAIGVLVAMIGIYTADHTSDQMATTVICSDPDSGKIIWQNKEIEGSDPVSPPGGYYKQMLAMFPVKNATLDKSCVLTDKEESIYDCGDNSRGGESGE